MNAPFFQRAVRHKARLRLAISGPAGSGKTYSALLIAAGIGGRIALIDTEHNSASLYSDLVEFDAMSLGAPFSPERYIAAIRAAEGAGYDTLVIDSLSHEWDGSGGLLEIVENIAKTKARGNTYAAWNEGTPRHNAMIEAILQSRMHVIATLRSKQDYVLTERNGKQTPQKVGMAPVQRAGLEYEFTAVLDIAIDGHLATATKDRTRLFRGDPFVVTPETGAKLRDWLESGADAPPPPAAAPQERPQARAPGAARYEDGGDWTAGDSGPDVTAQARGDSPGAYPYPIGLRAPAGGREPGSDDEPPMFDVAAYLREQRRALADKSTPAEVSALVESTTQHLAAKVGAGLAPLLVDDIELFKRECRIRWRALSPKQPATATSGN